MIKNLSTLISIIIAVFIFFLHGITNAPEAYIQNNTAFEYFSKIDTNQNPSQRNIENPQVKKFFINNFVLTPLAKYEISAMVVNKHNYHFGWESKLSPFDLALVWGGLVSDNYEKFIKYSQRNRWYYFNYTADSPYKLGYIHQHSSNNHIIPANENIKKAINSLKVKQKVLLKGYLVRVDGKDNGRNVWWKSSLSRNDRGAHSCEVFYVFKIMINNKIYE